MNLTYAILRSVFIVFSLGVNQLAEIYVSLKRLQDFLLLPEKDKSAIKFEEGRPDANRCGVWMKNITATWNKDTDATLKGITLNVESGELLSVIGSVGSGKTSLLMSILGEIPISSGEVIIKGKISYASQEAWVFNGTIRDNILFGQEYEENKYKKVLYVTALEKDISLFPKGDLTRVGERGVIMSGGQKARINLARAVYLDADIFILDDSLSAVDATVAKHIFEKCIMEYLSDKIRLLVTHQNHFLKSATKILLLKEGNCETIGDYNKIQDLEINLETSEKDTKSEKGIEFGNIIYDKEELSYNNEVDILPGIETNSDCAEKENGKTSEENKEISFKTFELSSIKAYLNAGAGLFFKIMIFFMLILAQVFMNGSDLWLIKWINDERVYYEHKEKIKNFTSVISNYNESESEGFAYSREINVYVHLGLILGYIVIGLISAALFFEMSMAASMKLHKDMFRCIIRTPISFLDLNPIGRILNRFSKDMMSVDDVLSFVFQNAMRIVSIMIGMYIVQAIISPYLLIFTIIVTFIFYFIWTIHSRVLKSIKYLEGKSRSPVFSHLSASLYGLTTIRAFNVEDSFKSTFNKYQDKHTTTWFLYVALNGWISIYGSIVTFINLVLVVIILYAVLNSDNAGSMMGLAITYGMWILVMYPWQIRQISEMDYQMNSVSRILNFSNLNSEAAYESSPDKKPPPELAKRGEIDFDNVSLQYSKDKHPVLKNLTFHINPGEKIGIVGRTGAGKSSLIAALFRMTEPTGTITIDAVDTKDIGLRDLRSRISIIPQDPVLFTGPLRRNIDPFNEYSEKLLWQVLEEVQLKDVVGKLTGGLDTNLMDGGRNFSVGQRQLICLARAVLRQNKILVMDEATSNIDNVTDSLIQKIIKEKFKSCSVLTIAHRLNTIIDSDRVLVLDHGKIQEFDESYTLLKNVNGTFYNLVKHTGKIAMKELFEISKEKHYLKNVVNSKL